MMPYSYFNKPVCKATVGALSLLSVLLCSSRAFSQSPAVVAGDAIVQTHDQIHATSHNQESVPMNTSRTNNGVGCFFVIAPGAGVKMTGAANMLLSSGGTLINNGSFDAASNTGSVTFLGSGTIAGTTTFQNIETFGPLDFGTASTIAGAFTIQPGGSVIGNSPVYNCPSSSLIYNTTGVFPRGLEWPSVISAPGYPSNVIVRNNTTINFPAAGAGFVCNDLDVESGSALYQSYSGASAPLTIGRNVNISGTLSLGNNIGDDITVGGNWTRLAGGVFNSNGRTVSFNGTNNSVITAPGSAARDVNGAFGGETFSELQINKSAETAEVTLGSNVSVVSELKLTKGIFNLANSDVTLVSNDSITAHVAPIPSVAGSISGVDIRYGTTGDGTGKFIPQRFLPIGTGSTSRRWRLLTTPLQAINAPTINEAWQEGVSNADRNTPVDPWPGFGTTITKSTTYNSADGYDQGSTDNPSLFYYSGTGNSGWSAPASTRAGAITDQQGYMLFVRGNRSIVVSSQYINAGPTTLEPKGRINTGDIERTLTTGYQPIGNPYASAISMNNVVFNNYTSGGKTYNNTATASANGTGITYYLWDPKTSGSSGVGKFIACSSNGDGTYSVTGNESGLPPDGTIQSGAAFLIAAENNGGTITFHENDKITSSSNIGVSSRTAGTTANSFTLVTNLYAGAGSNVKLADGVINTYNSLYSDEVSSEDAPKMSSFNTREVLSIAREKQLLAVERRNAINHGDTIFLHLSKMNKTAYEFQFSARNFDPLMTAFLQDTYTGTSQQINFADTTYVPFMISDDASAAQDRFHIVFRTAKALAATTTMVKAYAQNRDIAVEWTVKNQENIGSYAIEKSTNGQTFVQVNTTVARGSAVAEQQYSWIDRSAAPGNNFYRIKTIQLNGRESYSGVVKVNVASSEATLTVYPNPVQNGTINLVFKGEAAGNYQYKLVNSTGQVMHSGTLRYSGGSYLQNITTHQRLPAGTYELQVQKPQGLQVIKVMVL